MKKVLVVLASILILFSVGESALAVPSESRTQVADTMETVTRLTLISTIIPTLSVSGTTATYGLTVKCASTVTSIKATLQLQIKNSNGTWSDYGSPWTASSQTSILLTSGTKTVGNGATYRLKVTVVASDGTTTGEATAYSA